MNKSELEIACEIDNINIILNKVENSLVQDYQITSYNFLVEYLENPEWFESHSGRRLILLSLEILHSL